MQGYETTTPRNSLKQVTYFDLLLALLYVIGGFWFLFFLLIFEMWASVSFRIHRNMIEFATSILEVSAFPMFVFHKLGCRKFTPQSPHGSP
jgi:ABC-type uncharacterized transport system permease subunit